MNIALVGTGFVADYYMTTLVNYPNIRIIGAWDRDGERLSEFCSFYNVSEYENLDALLKDPEVSIVVNLTTPESHFDINLRALQAGKHVYCEKPLTTNFDQALQLSDFARRAGLTLRSAPANAFSDAHQLVAEALRENRIGTPRLVYAAMEDGPVFRENWANWRSNSGAPWPGRHEFAVGCTLEHAGYALSWLVSLFGPVEQLTAFSAVTFPDKGPGTDNLMMAPDFSVGCLRFKSGIVARLTCGLAAPKDRSLTILADEGSITVRDLWDERSVVHVEQTGVRRTYIDRLMSRLEKTIGQTLAWRPTRGQLLRYPSRTRRVLPAYPSQIDFARGIAEQAAHIEHGVDPHFACDLGLHITELTLALNSPNILTQPYNLKSSIQ